MQFSALIVAAMATVAAARCTPATYDCQGKYAWRVCNTSGRWVTGGKCPPETICKFFPPSLSPYCVPPDFEFP
ncbi:hypothetical protein EDB81DRAFT_879551 [Dactylonectria macrodidyma]|uniref:Uncharacterized protein n=1 Tax=Dactylonectria macrodidyma TaxID=307937 RepID=A0A9P9FE70_9HYPO|nr:hypothetical protein EDB81DRAFT_879551 [Dactylonectria macrodidyma]